MNAKFIAFVVSSSLELPISALSEDTQILEPPERYYFCLSSSEFFVGSEMLFWLAFFMQWAMVLFELFLSHLRLRYWLEKMQWHLMTYELFLRCYRNKQLHHWIFRKPEYRLQSDLYSDLHWFSPWSNWQDFIVGVFSWKPHWGPRRWYWVQNYHWATLWLRALS